MKRYHNGRGGLRKLKDRTTTVKKGSLQQKRWRRKGSKKVIPGG